MLTGRYKMSHKQINIIKSDRNSTHTFFTSSFTDTVFLYNSAAHKNTDTALHSPIRIQNMLQTILILHCKTEAYIEPIVDNSTFF